MLRSSPDREFHIANVVLVAPDLDGDVAITKIFKVFSDPDLPFGEKATQAHSFRLRPGSESPSMFRPTTRRSRRQAGSSAASHDSGGSTLRCSRLSRSTAIGMLRAVDIIEVRGTTVFFGHSYFVSNPRVSADIVAMLRYDLRPNEPGRPLEQIAGPFWRVPAQ